VKEVLRQFSESPVLICLSIALFFSYRITTFDKRIIQAKRSGVLPADHANLPRWVIVFHLLDWLILVSLLILNWKVALAVWAFLFVLKVLPVLETIGNVLMSPFKNSGTDHDKTL
jgi:hypothetical protein